MCLLYYLVYVYFHRHLLTHLSIYLSIYLLLIHLFIQLSIRSGLNLSQDTTHGIMKYSMLHYVVLPVQLVTNIYLCYDKLDF